jgi:4-amino-4-deoxy-L-arabinose transferase-like glycosyltransferase
MAIGLTAIAALGVVSVLLATRLGAGLTDDSYYYVKPARDALAGLGFNPSTYFSPLLPAALLLPGALGVEPLAAARFLYALLFGANILLVAAITRRITGSPAAGLLAGAWVLLSENLIDAHAWVMSEPLYFTFLLLAVWSALRFYPARSKAWLAAAGIFAGIACLARYAGLAVIPAIALLLLFDRRARFPRRLAEAAGFTLLAMLPVGLYFLRNLLVSGLATRYTHYLYVPFLRENLDWYLYNTLSWFVPGRFLHSRELLAGVALIAIVLALGTWAYLRGTRLTRPAAWAAGLLGAFALMNFVMLFLARGFQELDVYNTRYLTPVLLVLLALLAAGGYGLWRAGGKAVRAALALACLVFTVYYAFRAYDYVTTTARLGLGYANNGWHNSEMVAYLRQHPDLHVVATGDMGIYFWTGIQPVTINAYGGVPGLHQHLCASGDTLVIVNSMPTDIYGLDHDQVVQGLQRIQQFDDSEIYRCVSTGS